jgi:predicted Fe-Mo cluster-binding NifX family protein
MVRDSGREVAQFAEVFTWAIPCLGNQNNSLYNSRFGKSPFFALWSPEGTTFIANPCAEDEKNVGAKIVEYLYERGIQGIVISYLGPKAEEVAILKNFRIEKIEKDNVTVTDIINILKSNYYAK